MIQYFIFEIIFLKIFLAYNCFIFVQTFQRTSSECLLNSRVSSRKSQSQKKLAKKITHFTIQFRSKNLTILWASTHLTLKITCYVHQEYSLTNLPNFQQTCFCLVSEKILAQHHFLTPKNRILEVLWKKCLYISVYLFKKIFVWKT